MSHSQTELHQRFLSLWIRHESAVRAFVRRFAPSRADADDIMQEVSIVLWEKFDSFDANSDFRGWAFGVARFEVLAWLRDKGRDRLVLDEDVALQLADEANTLEPALSRQRAALELCMEKVPADQLSLLVQAYQPNSQIHEIARHSGRTVSGFYQWLHRIRKNLLDCIKSTLRKELFL